MSEPIRALRALGQSIWYDNLSRTLIRSGELARMVADGLAGVTSNPTIFEKAIGGTADYATQLAELVAQGIREPKQIYERLAITDIRGAADALRPIHLATSGRDGYVSLEVSPRLAHDTAATIDEARRLVAAVARTNVMIKVPGTTEGVPAVEELTASGINVNITLLFSIDAYRAVAEAYMTGLGRFAASGGDVTKVASVASFFLSRIDTIVDEQLPAGDALRGTIAVASAKLAYREYQSLIASPRWLVLAERGAAPQRLLWASTSTKNPAYPKLLYFAGLIGPDTINTVTGDLYREIHEHEVPARITVIDDLDAAEATLARLGEIGISLPEVTSTLTEQGIERFGESFDKLLASIGDARPGQGERQRAARRHA